MGIGAAVIGGSLISGVLGSSAASKASKAQAGAAREGQAAQERAAQAGIEEQRRQFDITQEQLQPFSAAGQAAISQQRILLGLGRDPTQEELQAVNRPVSEFGIFASTPEQDRRRALEQLGTPQAQQAAAVQGLQESAGQKFLRERGQRNLLRNAAAIGGIGGGNVREALVQQGVGFAQQDIENQFGRLGQLAGQGRAAATNVGQFGASAAGNIANLLGQQGQATQFGLQQAGQARASGILGQNQAIQQGIGGAFTGLAQGGFFGGGNQFTNRFGGAGQNPVGAPLATPFGGR